MQAEDPVEDPRMHQFVRKKQTVDSAVSNSDTLRNGDTLSNSDTLVDASVTVYPIDVDQGSPILLGEDHICYCTTTRQFDFFS